MNATINENFHKYDYKQTSLPIDEKFAKPNTHVNKRQKLTKRKVSEVISNEHLKDCPKPTERDLPFGEKKSTDLKRTKDTTEIIINRYFKDCPILKDGELPFGENKDETEQRGPKETFLEKRNHAIQNKETIINQAAEQINCRGKNAIKHSLDAAFNKLLHCNDEDFLNNPQKELKKFWETNKWKFFQLEQASLGSEPRAFEIHRKHFGPMVLSKTLEQINFFDKQYLHKNLRTILSRLIDNEDENLLLDPVGYLVDIWGLNKWQIIRTKREYQERVLLIANEAILWKRKNIKDEILQNGIQEFIRTENKDFLTNPIEKLKEYFDEKRPRSWHSGHENY